MNAGVMCLHILLEGVIANFSVAWTPRKEIKSTIRGVRHLNFNLNLSIQNAIIGVGDPHKLLCVPVLVSSLDPIFHFRCDLFLHGHSTDMCPLFCFSDAQSESERAERCQIHCLNCLYCCNFGAH